MYNVLNIYSTTVPTVGEIFWLYIFFHISLKRKNICKYIWWGRCINVNEAVVAQGYKRATVKRTVVSSITTGGLEIFNIFIFQTRQNEALRSTSKHTCLQNSVERGERKNLSSRSPGSLCLTCSARYSVKLIKSSERSCTTFEKVLTGSPFQCLFL